MDSENDELLRRLDDWEESAGPLLGWSAAHLRGCIAVTDALGRLLRDMESDGAVPGSFLDRFRDLIGEGGDPSATVSGCDHDWVWNWDWNGGPSDYPIRQCVRCNATKAAA